MVLIVSGVFIASAVIVARNMSDKPTTVTAGIKSDILPLGTPEDREDELFSKKPEDTQVNKLVLLSVSTDDLMADKSIFEVSPDCHIKYREQDGTITWTIRTENKQIGIFDVVRMSNEKVYISRPSGHSENQSKAEITQRLEDAGIKINVMDIEVLDVVETNLSSGIDHFDTSVLGLNYEEGVILIDTKTGNKLCTLPGYDKMTILNKFALFVDYEEKFADIYSIDQKKVIYRAKGYKDLEYQNFLYDEGIMLFNSGW